MSESSFPQIRNAVLQEIIQLAEDKYVYPEIGTRIAAQIKSSQDAGEYDDIDDPFEFAARLTADLRSNSNDHHWSVTYDPSGSADHVDPETEDDTNRMSRYLETARKGNFGFRAIEILKGNVGYIAIDYFHPCEYGGETAVAAMNFVANADALIIDIRKNHGGYPSMVQLVTSYLVEPEPQHLNTLYYRPTDSTQQFWTFPHVPGKRRPEIPLYVLISHETGSGAEEFVYNLKQMDRATLIGETTAGAAHPVSKYIVQQVFDVRVPYGRPINPISGGDWEGTGVEPDIHVRAEEALKAAHLKALNGISKQLQTGEERKDLDWVIEIIESDYSSPVCSEPELERFIGIYGQREFFTANGKLQYQHQLAPEPYQLIPMTNNRFRLEEDMIFDFQFMAEENASAVKVRYRDGRTDFNDKDSS